MAIEPIGAAARNYLRIVLASEQPHRPSDGELELAIICIDAGYLHRAPKGGRVVITDHGRSYLDQLARCE